MAVGTVAFVLFLAGFGNLVFFFPSGFLGLIALIFALGPDENYDDNSASVYRVWSDTGLIEIDRANCLHGER